MLSVPSVALYLNILLSSYSLGKKKQYIFTFLIQHLIILILKEIFGHQGEGVSWFK